MKKLLITLIAIFALSVTISADTITVSASVDGKGYKAKKKAKKVAQKKAIEKYILNKNKNINSETLDKITSEYPEYVLASTLQELEYDNGKTNTLYQIEIDAQMVNKKLATLGQSIQGLATNFIIIEEPLNLDTIDFFSDQDFVIYYEALQQKIKEVINQKMNDNGFKILTIKDNKKLQAVKEREPNLTGVYFNNKRKKYVVDKEFMKVVKKEYSSAIAIKYRVDFLTIVDSKIIGTLSLKLDDIATNSSISLGNLSYSIPLGSFSYNSIQESFSLAVKNIVSLMLNDLNEKVSEMVETRNNQPVIVAINLKSKRLAFKIKREIKKESKVSDIVIQNNSLKFYVNNSDAEEFLYDKILPLVEDKLNITVDDKFILINGKNIIINTDGKEFNDKNIKLIFI
jgi:hypothetical protein